MVYVLVGNGGAGDAGCDTDIGQPPIGMVFTMHYVEVIRVRVTYHRWKEILR